MTLDMFVFFRMEALVSIHQRLSHVGLQMFDWDLWVRPWLQAGCTERDLRGVWVAKIFPLSISLLLCKLLTYCHCFSFFHSVCRYRFVVINVICRFFGTTGCAGNPPPVASGPLSSYRNPVHVRQPLHSERVLSRTNVLYVQRGVSNRGRQRLVLWRYNQHRVLQDVVYYFDFVFSGFIKFWNVFNNNNKQCKDNISILRMNEFVLFKKLYFPF